MASGPISSVQFSSVQFTRSVVSNSLWPNELQHARPPCHHQLLECTQTHVHWVGDAIQLSPPLSSPFLPALNLSPASGSFQMSQLFAWGVQSIGVSASKSVSWKINTCFIVNPTGNQPWISLEALMLKMKLKYFGHLMQRVDSLEKTWMLGKIIGKRRMGWQRTRCLDSIINSMDMNLS